MIPIFWPKHRKVKNIKPKFVLFLAKILIGNYLIETKADAQSKF